MSGPISLPELRRHERKLPVPRPGWSNALVGLAAYLIALALLGALLDVRPAEGTASALLDIAD